MLFFALQASSQALEFKHYGPDQGLSQVSILALHQDENGFLWIGTRFGLNVFDGHNFKWFSHDPWDSTTLINSQVNQIITGADHTLWVGTDGGLCAFDQKLGVFRRVPTPTSYQGDWRILSLALDGEGYLWIGSNKGVSYIAPGTLDVIVPDVNYGDAEQLDVIHVFCGSKGEVWVGGNSGLFRAKGLGLTLNLTRIDIADQEILLGPVRGIYMKDETLWISSTQFLWSYHLKSGDVGRYENVFESAGEAIAFENRSITDGIDQDIWVSSYQGIFVFDTKVKKYVDRIYNSPQRETDLSDNSIHAMLASPNGDRWVGTYSGGLNYYSPRQNSFKLFRRFAVVPNTINSNIINAFAEGPDGKLYIGTSRGGLNVYDPKTESYSYDLEEANIRSLKFDPYGMLWIGSLFDGLIRYDVSTNQPYYYKDSEAPEGQQMNRAVNTNEICHIDQQGQLWVASWNNLYLYNRAEDSFEHYTYLIDDYWGDHTIKGILERGSELWLMAGDGIQVFDLQSKQFTKRYQHNPQAKNSLPSNKISGGVIDQNGDTWIASYGGLSKFNPEDESFQNFTTADGMPSNMALCILLDDDNKLWISTSNGLASLDTEEMNFKIFNKGDNLQGNAFREVACFEASNGDFLFGGTNGFNRFDPLKMTGDTTELKVILTDLLLYNKKVRPEPNSWFSRDLKYLDTLQLDYSQNSIAIGFTVIDFLDPRKNRYAYRLLGLDTDWVEVHDLRPASYNNLRPGSYFFEIKAANDNSKNFGPITRLYIEIVPPFWETVWFRCMMFFALIIFVWGIHRLRIRSLVKQKKLLDQGVKRRTKIIRKQKEQLEEQNQNLMQAEEEVRTANELLKNANEQLEKKVLERTQSLKAQNNRIKEYAFLNAHKVRSPLVRILGLIGLLKSGKLSPDEVSDMRDKIHHSAIELDEITRKINEELDDREE